jgi:hypothetical protein
LNLRSTSIESVLFRLELKSSGPSCILIMKGKVDTYAKEVIVESPIVSTMYLLRSFSLFEDSKKDAVSFRYELYQGVPYGTLEGLETFKQAFHKNETFQ